MQKINKTWLLNSIQKIAEEAFDKSGHSLNGLPEYYVNVKLADELSNINRCFELEYQTTDLAKELGIENAIKTSNASKYRLKKGAIDLVVQSPREYKSQHLIEIKRSSKLNGLRADLERLTWFVSQGTKKSLNKAYVVLINPLDIDTFKKRTEREEKHLRKEFNNKITLTYKTGELSDFNTRRASLNSNENNAEKSINALIWEIKLKNPK